MKKAVIIFIFAALFLLLGALSYLAGTGQGILTVVRIADRLLPGSLSVTAADGRLIDSFSLTGLRYEDASASVFIDSCALHWQPTALGRKTFAVRILALDGVHVLLPKVEEDGGSAAPESSGATFNLPLSVSLEKITVNTLSIRQEKDAVIEIGKIALAEIEADGERLQIGHGAVTGPWFEFSGSGSITTSRDDLAVRLGVSYSIRPEGYGAIEGDAQIKGPLAGLECTANLRSPFQATLSGSINTQGPEPSWKAELQSDEASLAEIHSQWPGFSFSRFIAYGEGTLASYALRAEADADYGEAEGIHVSTTVTGDAYGLQLTDTSFSKLDGFLTGAATMAWQDDFTWEASLAGTLPDLPVIHPAWPPLSFAHLELAGNGVNDTYSVHVESEAGYQHVDDVQVAADIHGDGNGLRFTDTTLTRAESILRGEGTLSWQDAFTWQVDLYGEKFDPAQFNSAFPGSVDFYIITSGMLAEDTKSADVDIRSLAGELRSYPVRAAGRLVLEGTSLLIDDVQAETAGTSLLVNGRYGDEVGVDFRLQSKDLAAIWPEMTGSLKTEGKISGKRIHPDFFFDLTGEGISLASVTIDGVAGRVGGELVPDGQLEGSLRADGFRAGGFSSDTVTLALRGTINSHTLVADLTGPDISLNLVSTGGYDKEQWTGNIESFAVASEKLRNWQLAGPAPLLISQEVIDLNGFCLDGPSAARFCIEGHRVMSGEWEAQAESISLPLSLARGTLINYGIPDGVLTGKLVMNGQGASLTRGHLELDTAAAEMLLTSVDEEQRRIGWQRNSLKVELVDTTISGDLSSILQDGSAVNASLRLTDVGMVPFSFTNSQVEGTITLDVRDLQPIGVLTFPYLEPHGSLRGDFAISGTVDRPAIRGHLKVGQGRMTVLPLGINLENMTTDITGDGRSLKLNLAATSGPGRLTADGILELAQDEKTLVLTFSGEEFEAVRQPELHLLVSPDVKMSFSRKEGRLTGDLVIPEALIAPTSLAGTVQASRDVVIVDDPAAQDRQAWPLYAMVDVVAGENVLVDAFGLKGRIAGNLKVSDLPRRPTTGEGMLRVEEGTFAVYGRQLRIETGRLLFSGGPIDNPGIDVRAENTTDNVTTGIQVSGFLQQPEIRFYSTPPMEEGEIISRLLMNTSLIGSSAEDRSFLGSVASSSGLDGITSTIRDVKETLRVDDVKIEAGRASDDLSLVIGTWLTPKLYVSYGKNLLKETGSFNTRYNLGRGFSIQTESGTLHSGADLKYEFEH